MAAKGKAFLYLRGAMIFLALLLPMVSLMPLGWLWLWQRGYALYWLAAAFSLAIVGYVAQVITLRRTFPAVPRRFLQSSRAKGGRCTPLIRNDYAFAAVGPADA